MCLCRWGHIYTDMDIMDVYSIRYCNKYYLPYLSNDTVVITNHIEAMVRQCKYTSLRTAYRSRHPFHRHCCHFPHRRAHHLSIPSGNARWMEKNMMPLKRLDCIRMVWSELYGPPRLASSVSNISDGSGSGTFNTAIGRLRSGMRFLC